MRWIFTGAFARPCGTSSVSSQAPTCALWSRRSSVRTRSSLPGVGLSANARPNDQPPRSRRRMLRWAAIVVLGALIACALLWIVVGSSATSVALNANSVVVIDQHAREVAASAPTGSFPLEVVLAGGSAWISNSEEDTVTQVDVRTRHVVRTMGLGFEPTGACCRRRGGLGGRRVRPPARSDRHRRWADPPPRRLPREARTVADRVRARRSRRRGGRRGRVGRPRRRADAIRRAHRRPPANGPSRRAVGGVHRDRRRFGLGRL